MRPPACGLGLDHGCGREGVGTVSVSRVRDGEGHRDTERAHGGKRGRREGYCITKTGHTLLSTF